jgi:hypothetical protein
MSMNQKEAVYTTALNVLAENDIPFDDGQDIKPLITKEMRANIITIITQGITSGEVEMTPEGRAKHDTEPKRKSYVNGLVSNWFRKDSRLNGGVKYESKAPGSRAGSQDEQIKALKALRTLKADDQEAVQAINEAIKARQAELKPAKAVALTAEQVDLIPEELREKLGL